MRAQGNSLESRNEFGVSEAHMILESVLIPSVGIMSDAAPSMKSDAAAECSPVPVLGLVI